jgi:hypothetical protein
MPIDRPGLRVVLKVKLDFCKAARLGDCGVVELALPAAISVDEIVPYLDAVRDAGYLEVDAIARRPPRSFVTRTRGTFLEPEPICRLTTHVDAALSAGATWGQVVEQLEARFLARTGSDVEP